MAKNDESTPTTNFLVQTVAAAVGPEQFLQYINPSELIRRFAASDGIDTAGLVKDEQATGEAEQAQNQRLMLEQQLTEGAYPQWSNKPNPTGGSA